MHLSPVICASILLIAPSVRAQPAPAPETTRVPEPVPAPATGMRNWTDAQGRTMQATLKAIEGSDAVFLMASGQTLKFPLSRLSVEDQAFVKTNAASLPRAPAGPGTGKNSSRVPIEKRTWPDIVVVPSRAVEIEPIVEKPEERHCVYRSEAFEFIAEDKLAGSVMNSIAQTFESTRSLLIALPWGVDPKPPIEIGRFQAKFYKSRASYMNEGGPANSGGVYMERDRVFRIPFQSLGLEMRGKTWFKNDDYRNDTIIHEITHQLMHDFLRFLPIWVIEGAAEYTEMLPYNAGKFLAGEHKRGIKEYLADGLERGLTPSDIGKVEAHINMTRDEWTTRSGGGVTISNPGSLREMSRLYYSSCLLVYYFCHLDGDGRGIRFMKYLDKVKEARDAWNAFLGSPLVTLDKEAGRYSWDPGRISAPSQPQSEAYGLGELGILLDGRTPAQLEKDVIAGFAKMGVKW